MTISPSKTKLSFRPSELKRLRLCPGSYAAAYGLKNIVGDDAHRGTRIHAALNRKYCKGDVAKCADISDEEYKAFAILDGFTHQIIEQHGGLCRTPEGEITLKIETDDYNIVGHPDLTFVCNDGTFHLVDWKSGYGEQDAAEDHDQLMGYVWLIAHHTNIEEIYAHVVTPRGISTYLYKLDDIQRAIKTTHDTCINALAVIDRTPSADACKYCPAFGSEHCPESVEQALSVGDIKETTLSKDTLIKVLPLIPLIDKLIKKAEAQAKQMLEADSNAFNGEWELKPGNTRRTIENVQAAFDGLDDVLPADKFAQCCTVGISDLEKAVAEIKNVTVDEAKQLVNARLSDVIETKQNKPSLVRGKTKTIAA